MDLLAAFLSAVAAVSASSVCYAAMLPKDRFMVAKKDKVSTSTFASVCRILSPHIFFFCGCLDALGPYFTPNDYTILREICANAFDCVDEFPIGALHLLHPTLTSRSYMA